MQSLSPNSDMKQVLNYNTDELTLPNEQFSTYQQIESLLKQKSPRLVKKKDEIENYVKLKDHFTNIEPCKLTTFEGNYREL